MTPRSCGASRLRCGCMGSPSSTGRGRPSAMPTRSRRLNPLRRVPTLVFEDGEVLIESTAILDYLDEVVGPTKAMIAESGPERRHALKICALATGLGDKAVSLVYERALRRISQGSGSSVAKPRSRA